MRNLDHPLADVRIFPCAPKLQNCTNRWGVTGKLSSNLICYVLEGNLPVRVEKKLYIVKKHQMCLMPEGVDIACWKIPDQTLKLYEFGFRAECEDMDLFTFYGMTKDQHVVSVPLPKIQNIVNEMLYPTDLPANGPHRINYCAELSRLCAIYLQARINLAQAKMEFSDVIDYMRSHLTDDIALEKLAEIMYLNPSYFSTKFKEKMGMSPMRYLAELRAKEAARLLGETDWSEQKITQILGFSRIYYFRDFFEKHMGIQPEVYREMLRTPYHA